MRIAVFIAGILLANLITLGAAALLVLTRRGDGAELVWLPVAALAVLVDGPLLLGSLLSYWDVRASPETWRAFRWWFRGVYAAQSLGVVAVVVYTVLTGAAAWLPVAVVLIGVVLNVLAVRVGVALRRRDDSRRPAVADWEPITRRSIARSIVIVSATFAVVLVVGSIAFGLLFSLVPVRHRTAEIPFVFALEFAFMGAALACIIATLRVNRRLREDVSRDVGTLRRIGTVVLRGKPVPLDPGEEAAAARYAALTAVSLPFTLTYVVLLFVGLGFQQVASLLDGTGGAFMAVYLCALIALLLGILPLYVIRIRRVRAYAAEHAHLLPTGAGVPTASDPAQG